MNEDRFNDAWVFLSIGDARGCTGLVGPDALMSMADANNHDTPTSVQLDRAIRSLTTAGLVVAMGDDLAFTDEGCAAYQAANALGLRHIDRMFALAEVWTRDFPPTARTTP